MTLVGVIVPLALAILAAILVVTAIPELPDPIAIHWGPAGEADGFGPVWVQFVVLFVSIGLYSALALAVIASSGAPSRAPGGAPSSAPTEITVNQKVIIATAPCLAMLLAVLVSGSTLMQRGLTDAAAAPSVVPVLVLALGLGAGSAVLAWFVLPTAASPRQIERSDVPTLDLSQTQRAVWLGNIGPSRWVGALSVAMGALSIIGGGVVVWAAAPILEFVVYLAFTLGVAALVASTVFWRARIDESGMLVVSALGLPRYFYPLRDIDAASTSTIDPVRDFGGWGLRWGGSGRFGIVTRRGIALEVGRTNGKVFVVTVDGAEQGASVLNALVTRDRQRSAG